MQSIIFQMKNNKNSKKKIFVNKYDQIFIKWYNLNDSQ